ncbi:hypothetical protein [Massilia sp. CF038]|uniref:hypothetical protein n=1 Tax=Massilia sp. CF038 TaxID=1881045 RepID=UPI00091BAAA9|nr:hypothetical protein [Massilia sp. CF038]SHH67173.1 hypothetical protein SAMN05428948_4870 [Massilia sp. CF038]
MHEIHLTTANIASAEWPAFEQFATDVGAKILVIELARGNYPLQPMLTLAHDGDVDAALVFAHGLAQQCSKHYPVVRCKIEQALVVADTDASTRPPLYFEWHGRVPIAPSTRPQLSELSQRFGGHLSNNVQRGSDNCFVTLRETGAFAALAARVDALCAALSLQGWAPGKQQWERVVYDSNLSLDTGWLESVQ